MAACERTERSHWSRKNLAVSTRVGYGPLPDPYSLNRYVARETTMCTHVYTCVYIPVYTCIHHAHVYTMCSLGVFLCIRVPGAPIVDHTCAYLCIYMCTCIYLCTCVHQLYAPCVYICIFMPCVYLCTPRMWVPLYSCVYLWHHTCVHIYTCVHALCIYTCVHYAYGYLHVYSCVYLCGPYLCAHIHLCIHVNFRLLVIQQ